MQEEEIARKEKDGDLAGKSRRTAGAGRGGVAHCHSCHDVPRCVCLYDASTVEVRADPTEGRKSGLLEFRTFLGD